MPTGTRFLRVMSITRMDLSKVLEKCADLDEEFNLDLAGGKQVKTKIFKQKIEMMIFIF